MPRVFLHSKSRLRIWFPDCRPSWPHLIRAFRDAIGIDPNFNNVTAYDGAIFFEGSSIYFGYQANVSYEINDFISVALGGRYVTAKNTYQGYINDVTITASPAALPG